MAGGLFGRFGLAKPPEKEVGDVYDVRWEGRLQGVVVRWKWGVVEKTSKSLGNDWSPIDMGTMEVMIKED